MWCIILCSWVFSDVCVRVCVCVCASPLFHCVSKGSSRTCVCVIVEHPSNAVERLSEILELFAIEWSLFLLFIRVRTPKLLSLELCFCIDNIIVVLVDFWWNVLTLIPCISCLLLQSWTHDQRTQKPPFLSLSSPALRTTYIHKIDLYTLTYCLGSLAPHTHREREWDISIISAVGLGHQKHQILPHRRGIKESFVPHVAAVLLIFRRKFNI